MNNPTFYVETSSGSLGLPGTIQFALVHLDPIVIGTIQTPTSQSDCAIAIGKYAGLFNPGECAIAIGKSAGQTNQGMLGIAIGSGAGSNTQAELTIALGMNAGTSNPSTNAIAIGTEAGMSDQGENAIAMGTHTGQSNQGGYALAMGAYAGQTNQHARTVVLNATGSPLNTLGTDRTYLAPVRPESGNTLVQYSSDQELTTSTTVNANLTVKSITATNIPKYELFIPNPIPTLSTRNLFNNFLNSADKWVDSVYIPSSNKIYFIPFSSTYVLVVDSLTDTIVNRIQTFDAMPAKWRGGVLAPNGKIYCVPSNSTYVLIIDPNTDTLDQTSITGLSTLTTKYEGGVLHPNGKIYCIPRNATFVLIIDPATNTVDTTSIVGLVGNDKYINGAISGGKIYCCPASATNMLVIDPISPVTTLGATFGINPATCTVTSNIQLNCAAGTNLTIPVANISQVERIGGTANITLSTVASTWFLNIGDSISIYGLTNDNNTFNAVQAVLTNVSGNVISYANAGANVALQVATGTTRFISRINIGDNLLLTTTLGNYTGYVQAVTSATVVRFIHSLAVNLSAGQILSIQRTRRADITTFRGLSTSGTKYIAGSFLSDGKMYVTPIFADNVLVVDPNSLVRALPGTPNSATYINGSPTPRLLTCPGANFLTSVTIGDNLLIDLISTSATGRYMGIVQSIIDNTNVVLLNVLGANITAGNITNIRVSRRLDLTLSGLPTTGTWTGSAVTSNKIYSFPYLNTNGLIIDSNSPSTALNSIGATYTNSTKTLICPNESFLTSVNIGDNLVVNATGVVVSGALTGQRIYIGYVQSIQSNTTLTLMYALGTDLSAVQITSIQKTRKLDLTTYQNIPNPNGTAYYGGCVGSTGKIYGASNNSNNLLILTPTSPRTPIPNVVPSLCSYNDSTRTLSCPGATFATPGPGQVNIGDNIILITNTVGGEYTGYVETVVDNQTLVFFSAVGPFSTSSVFGVSFAVGQITTIQKTRFVDITTVTFSNGRTKYSGAVLARNGKIYAAPNNTNDGLIIDPTNNTTDLSTLTGFETDNLFGGVLAPNGKIYYIPLTSKNIKVIDPATNNIETLVTSTTQNFGCAGGVLALNGKIYCIPYFSTTTSVPIIDPMTNSIDTTTLPIPSGSNRWIGGVLAPNGKIYGIPADSTSVLIIDPVTNTVDTTTITGLTGSGKWFGGVLGKDGNIYGMPYNSTTVLIINPTLNSVNIFDIVGLVGPAKYVGGTLVQDGKIYGVPNFATNVLVLDPSSPITLIPGVTPGTSTYTNSTRVLNCPGATFLTSLSVGDNILIFSSTSVEYTGYVQSITDNQNLVFIYALGVNLTAGNIISIRKTRKADITTLPIEGANQNFAGSVLAPNGDIYMMPRDAGTVLVVNPGLATEPNWMIQAYFNKL